MWVEKNDNFGLWVDEQNGAWDFTLMLTQIAWVSWSSYTRVSVDEQWFQGTGQVLGQGFVETSDDHWAWVLQHPEEFIIMLQL